MLTDLPAAQAWSNSVGNQSFTPGYAAAPRDEEELAALVRRPKLDPRGVFLNAHLRELFA